LTGAEGLSEPVFIPLESAPGADRNAIAALEREFRYEPRHFDFIVRLIHRLAGISLAPHKIEMVYARLARRLRSLGLRDFDAYCDLLDSEAGADEVGFLVNALTTNLTSFFRESHHFDHLGRAALPAFVRREAGKPKPRLRIWSAGCSSGAEPYTISMIAASTIADIHRWDARVLATDIDTHMVETARAAVYPEGMADDIPPRLREAFTRRAVDERGGPAFSISGAARAMVTAKPLNLLESWPMKGRFDAVFCRNVLIYFDRIGRARVVERFADILADDGFLYLGHSETLHGVTGAFRQIGATIYRKS